MSAILVCDSVSKQFGGLAAISDLTFELREGEILGLIGPNGAGKTTLINLITGVDPPTAGTIRFKGQRISGLKPDRIGRLGIARTFQVVKPFQRMTVLENVAVGAMFGKTGASRNTKQALAKAEEVLQTVGLASKRDAVGDALTIPDRKRLELARALAMEPDVLLLDEVMAGLNATEITSAMELVQSINAQGVSILVIEHVMKAIMGISQRILVLHHGRKIAEGAPAEIIANDTVIEAYLGARYAQSQRGAEMRAAAQADLRDSEHET